MVPPVNARVAENAQIECCTKCTSRCSIFCCIWRRKTSKGDITPVSDKTLQEIEKSVEAYEKRRNSIQNDPDLR